MPAQYWLPAALGLIAAAGNYAVLSRATATHTVLALRADVKPGQPLQESHLHAVPVRGGGALFQGIVPFDQRDAVYGKTVRRHLKAGELLLRADVEAQEYQVDPTALREGETTLTLPARLSAVDSRPYPGCLVMLIIRQTGPTAYATPVKSYGRFRLLGWTRTNNPRDPDGIVVSLAVPATPGVNEPELRAIQNDTASDRLLKIEIVGTP